ncbi:MAG: response regulator transcription factor [Planctomycetota bacterium]
MEPIRVLFADDHSLMRAGIRSMLQTIPDVDVVGEARDGLEALELVATLHPQVLLTDIKMPRLDGLETTKRVSAEFPDVRVIILSTYGSEDFIRQAVKFGAVGYVSKDSSVADLESAIKSAVAGEKFVSPVVLKNMMKMISCDDIPTSASQFPATDPLTRRQRDILQEIVQGKTIKAIAIALDISPKTVESHRAQLMERLGIDNVPDLVRYAIKTGSAPPEERIFPVEES